MNSILTPKSAIEHAIERVYEKKTQPLKFISFDSKWEQNTFIFLLIFLTLSVFSPLPPYVLVIGLVISFVLHLFSLIPGKSILNKRVDGFNDDIDLIYKLSKDYQEHHLEYAKNSVEQEINQLRGKIGVAVGLIEKVGFLPLGIATYYQFVKFQEKELPIPSWNEIGILFCIIMVYLIAIRLRSVSQEFEKIVLILDQALSLKRTSERNTADDK